MYKADDSRYKKMIFNRCGNSGIKLPVISLGLWQNFGAIDDQRVATEIVCEAFDAGITHFDLANNYGPPPGSAEEFFGGVLRKQFSSYRDELIISTKAGYTMWNGPYGDWGSKKYMIASLDQSLKRMRLDYVDIFYSHRPDPETPIEETMGALSEAVKQGKALYVGLSNYNAEQTKVAIEVLDSMGVKCLIHQPKYSMFERWTEEQRLFDVLDKYGVGSIAFSPLAQGLLTNRYLGVTPDDSRIAKGLGFLREEHLTEEKLDKVRRLNEIAYRRGQSLACLALIWVLRNNVTSVLIGVSKSEQLVENLSILENLTLSKDEVEEIDCILENNS